jgi:hypothetical protein
MTEKKKKLHSATGCAWIDRQHPTCHTTDSKAWEHNSSIRIMLDGILHRYEKLDLMLPPPPLLSPQSESTDLRSNICGPFGDRMLQCKDIGETKKWGHVARRQDKVHTLFPPPHLPSVVRHTPTCRPRTYEHQSHSPHTSPWNV